VSVETGQVVTIDGYNYCVTAYGTLEWVKWEWEGVEYSPVRGCKPL